MLETTYCACLKLGIGYSEPEWVVEGRRLRAKGLSWREIAKRLGRFTSQVHKKCTQPPVPRRVRTVDPVKKEVRYRRELERQKIKYHAELKHDPRYKEAASEARKRNYYRGKLKRNGIPLSEILAIADLRLRKSDSRSPYSPSKPLQERTTL